VNAALALGASTPVAAANAAVTAPADAVLRGGFIYTVDGHDSVQQAIAIRQGRIVYVGADRGIQPYIGPTTSVIELHGKMVLPGLVDAHNHAIAGGSQLLECDLKYAPLTVAQFQQKIQACLNETRTKEPDSYLMVVGWYRQAMQPSGTQVTKANLDGLKTRRPILVGSTDGHTTLGNSRAMALAGITRNSPDPHAGRIDRDGSGEPSGIFEDTAEQVISRPVPPPTTAETLKAAEAALDAFRKDGETAFMMQDSTKTDIQAWSTLQKQGRLTARAYMAPDVDPDAASKPGLAVARILDLKREFDTGPIGPRANLWVRNSGEIFQDGVLQWPAHTASTLEPYLVNKGTNEKPNWVPGPTSGPDPYIPLPQLEPLLLALANAGIEPEVHAIGDRAVRHTLDAYAYVRQHLNGRDVRLEMAHAELVDPADVPRFKELNVVADMGFQWSKPSFDSIDAAKDYLGPTRFNRMEPEGYLYQAGATLAQGSDWPVDPLSNWFDMQVLVTRKGTMSGKYAGALGTVPGVPVKGAIRAFTINGAYALHSEQYFGSLEQGKLADLIVINQNLLQIPTSRIADTKVLLTMLGGEIVFRDPSL
ncbi:MAG TPA: amidohydrolase, partial [Steroidobacteraceae bacterium]|nr:amidohydrolase [Steroidobacteraceae bacterium]